MEIPMTMGYHFKPCDHELLMFLFRFVTGRNVHEIRYKDIFGDNEEPWDLFSSEKTHYFFTKLKRKSKGKKKQGKCQSQDKGKPVFDKEGRALLGYKRSFVYKNKNKKEAVEDGQWLLKEFYLSDAVIKKGTEKYPILEKKKDFVLCQLKRKNKRTDQESNSAEGIKFNSIIQDFDD